ncbi:hypothetical protein [Variovorax sp. OV700]|uniref:hypothetical protein n=1 Tax=Variovorax sp. OV700 TaxID=1882826 RepID=UPI00088A0768|nr:hypothetical protein [Variovorax sp. OV700]SDJ83501.1 hypothetical protein SAMN05444748_1312 [Variovorax sp. OV700]
MKTSNLVNAYVLPNLFYELMFLEERIDLDRQDWSDQKCVDKIIQEAVLPRFSAFTVETKTVVRNTLRYLLATQGESSEMWDIVWQASSAPIPTPHGVRSFVQRSYELLFGEEPLPLAEELQSYNVNHEMQLANRLN